MGDDKTCAKCTATEAHLSTIKEAHAKLGTDHEKLLKEHTQLLTTHTTLTTQLKAVEDWAVGEAQRDGQLTATLSASSGKRPELGTLLGAISTRNKGLLDERTQIVALTGKPDGVLGMLTAWSEQSKELATLKATQQKERIEALTAQYKTKAESSVEQGLLTPAQRKRCDEVLAASGVEQAMVMLSVIVPDGAQPVVNRIETPTPDAAGDVLSAAEVRNLNVIGLSAQAYLATRKAQRL